MKTTNKNIKVETKIVHATESGKLYVNIRDYFKQTQVQKDLIKLRTIKVKTN